MIRLGRMASISVLVVDDEPLLQRLLELSLTRMGYDCLKASNGIEALAQLQEGRPDLVIMDVMMPYMDGFELVTRMQRDEIGHIPTIVLTADCLESDHERALSLGADKVLMKPIGAKELEAHMQSLLL